MAILMTLPWPPSVNSYWSHTRTGHSYLSIKGRQYCKAVEDIVYKYYNDAPSGRISVVIHATPPDSKIRDIDNINKGVFDALTKCGFWVDDYLVNKLEMIRDYPEWPGRLDIYVQQSEIQS